MIPIHMLTKLARSRSQVALATKSFVTSGALWKQGGHKSEEENPKEGSQKLQQGCCFKDDAPANTDKQYDKKQQKRMSHGPPEEDRYIEAKKQGEGSSCGPIKPTDKYLKENKQRTHKQTNMEIDDSYYKKDAIKDLKSRGCSCAPYDTPKLEEGLGSMKEQKTTSVCPEKQNRPKGEAKSEPDRSRFDPCENRRPKQTQEEDKCHEQKINSPSGSKNTSHTNMCPSERGECRRDNTPKRFSYCGPDDSYGKQSIKDPCGPIKTSTSNCRGEETECVKEGDPCKTVKSSHRNYPDKKNECNESNEQYSLDPCETSRKRDFSEENKEECLEEEKVSVCLEDSCKKQIEIPELSKCCKVDAAKECLCKLKELQKQWEEVVAAHEGGKKDDCETNKSQTGSPDFQEPARMKHKRSNLIYVVLCAILAAVVYYTYNEDFEPEELFLDDEEVKKHDDDEDD